MGGWAVSIRATGAGGQMIERSMTSPAVAQPAPPQSHGRPAWLTPPELSWPGLRHLVEHTIPSVLTAPLTLAWLFTLTSAVITMFQVRDYYLVHLPHFDSIGAYTYAYNVMNTAVTQGRIPAIRLAAQNNLGWLEPFYALPFSWLPNRTPALLITMNFVLMALTQATIADWGRLNGYSRRHQLVLLLLPFLPGALYAWDGGLPDWRRDAPLNILLIGDLFLSLAYVQRPTAWRGVALGVLVGLTQLSRDNALSMVALVVFPAIVLAFVSALRAAGGRVGQAGLTLVQIAWRPLVVFLILTLPYYSMTWQATLYRYTNLVWGPGEDRLKSLEQFWTSPYDVLLGGTTMFNGHAAVAEATRWILLVGLGLVAVLLVTRVVLPSAGVVTKWRSRVLLGSGSFVVVAVILYNTVGLGYGAQYHGVPFFPVLVGMTAIFAGLTDLVKASPSCCRQTLAHLALGLAIVAFIPANTYRVQENEFDPVGNDMVRTAREAALKISETADRRAVAVYWFDGFSSYHVNYYLAETRRNPIIIPEKIDGPLRNGETPDQWFARMRQATDERAGVVVVNTELFRYANPEAEPGLFHDGGPFIQSLLDDPRYTVVHRFRIASYEFAVLDNTALPKPPRS
jgi:hypothetical protein